MSLSPPQELQFTCSFSARLPDACLPPPIWRNAIGGDPLAPGGSARVHPIATSPGSLHGAPGALSDQWPGSGPATSHTHPLELLRCFLQSLPLTVTTPIPTQSARPLPPTPNTLHRHWCVVTLVKAAGDRGGHTEAPPTPTLTVGTSRGLCQRPPCPVGQAGPYCEGSGASGGAESTRSPPTVTRAAPPGGPTPAPPGSWLPAGGW